MKDGAAQPKGNWTATVAETLLGRDCAVTWMRVHSGHWTVGLQGQSVFFTSTANDRWSRQMVTAGRSPNGDQQVLTKPLLCGGRCAGGGAERDREVPSSRNLLSGALPEAMATW